MKIGITGGIGSGKTLVTNCLRKLGACVICADEITHDLYRSGNAGAIAVEAAFGAKFLNEDGVDRKKLGACVIENPENMKKLNQLIHPLIHQVFIREIAGLPLVFFDAAILIESGWYRDMDAIWLVVCDMDIRIKRLSERGGMDETAMKKMMDAQMPDAEKMRYADFVIDNTGSEADTCRQVSALYSALKQK